MPRPPAKRTRLPLQAPTFSSTKGRESTKKNTVHINASNNSDDSDGLVTSISGRHNSRGIISREIFMSGGLGDGGTDTAHKITPTKRDDASSSKLPEGAVAVLEMRRGKDQTPVTKFHEQAIESSPMAERVAADSRPPTRARGYSSTLSLAGRKADMSSRIPGTPAFESSMLSNFRRRPRQPSILQMMQANGSSDLDDDDDFLGGLSPEDESTPLNLSRGKSLLRQPSISPSTSPLPSSESSRKRKRTPVDAQAPESPTSGAKNSQSGFPISSSDEDRSDASNMGLPAAAEPEDFNQTIAPPLSSSPVPYLHRIVESDSPRLLRSRSAREEVSDNLMTRNGVKAGGVQVQLSTAALQEKFLPRRQRQRRNASDRIGVDISSDASEVDFQQHSSDDDELSYLPSRKVGRSRRKGLVESNNVTNAKVKPKATDRYNGKKGRSNVAHGTYGTKATTTQSSAAKASKVRRWRDNITYSSRQHRDIEIDKENLLSNTSSTSPSPASEEFVSDSGGRISKPAGLFYSEELELQAKKFAEIDKWQMDFEDIMGSGSQQSSFR